MQRVENLSFLNQVLRPYDVIEEIKLLLDESYQRGLVDGRRPYLEANKRSRNKFKAMGKCVVCGKTPLEGKTLCEKHAIMQSIKQKRYNQKTKSNSPTKGEKEGK